MEDLNTSAATQGLNILEERWGKLRLTEEEQVSITLGEEEVSEMDNIKERRSLVGKIFSERSISRDTIQTTTMGKIWKLTRSASFKEVEKNLFIITFATEAEKQMVFSGKPWLFDNSFLHYNL